MRILVVEDEHRIAQAIKQGLAQESYAVDICYDGNEGYNTASAEAYDVILLDVMLPGMTGFEITKKLRDDQNHTPILLLTAKDQPRDIVTGLNSGADDYLAKPFSFEVLLARIHALLRRPAAVQADELAVGDLTLNTTTKEVKRADQPITLSTKEFALLEYLMRNNGQVLSKNNIISHVWNFDADVLPNTVEVFVAYLRNKVDRPFDSPALIQTVRGFGYKVHAA